MPHRTNMIREIEVSTTLQPHEDIEIVMDSVKSFFPDWSPDLPPRSVGFPSGDSPEIIHGLSSSLDSFLDAIRKQSILDTALDAMTIDGDNSICEFSISRLASLAGKVSFTLGERTFGGSIDISISGIKLLQWLESATWHEGRRGVPRYVGDDLAMNRDGSYTEWFDRRGNLTRGPE